MREDSDGLLQLSFDKYQRYKIAEEIVNAVRYKRRLKILDAGSNEGLLQRFLPDDDVFSLDIEVCKDKRFVRGNASQMPFRDKEFDIVVSIDVFEHIPADDRDRFLKEQLRVSNRLNIIGAPYFDKEVSLAENILYNFICTKYDLKHEMLDQHFKNTLPDLKRTLDFIKGKRWDFVCINNGYLYNWLFMMLVNFHFEWMDSAKMILPKINEFYNANFYAGDNKAPAYRKIIVVSKDKNFDLRNIADKYKYQEEDNNIKMHKIELANLLMKSIELEGIREKEKEVNSLKEDFKEKIKILTEWSEIDKRRLGDELNRISQESSKEKKVFTAEITRLNREIESLHKGYAQRIQEIETEKGKEKSTLSNEIERLNEEIGRLHSSYTCQIDRLAQEKEKFSSALSCEIDRLNKGIESLHKNYSQKIKDADQERSETQVRFTAEITRLNREIESLHKGYAQRIQELETEKGKEKSTLSNEIERLNEEIGRLHSSYTCQIDRLDKEKDKTRSNLANEIERLNVEIEIIHKNYSQRLKEVNLDKEHSVGSLSEDVHRLNESLISVKTISENKIKNLEEQNNILMAKLNRIYSSPFYKFYKKVGWIRRLIKQENI